MDKIRAGKCLGEGKRGTKILRDSPTNPALFFREKNPKSRGYFYPPSPNERTEIPKKKRSGESLSFSSTPVEKSP